MAKTGQNATAYRNNYWVLRFTVVDEDVVGEPALDITALRVFYAVCRLSSSGAPLVNAPLIDVDSTDDPSVVVKTSPTAGEVEVRVLASVNAALSPRDYYHELEVKDGLGNPVVAMTGTLTVLPNVANA